MTGIYIFSFGAMMSPSTLSIRDIRPKESHVARLIEPTTRLSFRHRAAYATLTTDQDHRRSDPLSYARPFGVVHELTEQDFARVAEREVGYRITRVKVELLDVHPPKQMAVDAFTSAKGMELMDGPLPPTDRYRGLLLEGLEHYGIGQFDGGQEYIDWVRSVPTVDVASDPSYDRTYTQMATKVALTGMAMALLLAMIH